MLAHLNIFELTALIGASSMIAGFFGALTGLGGGVIIVPLLVLVFGVDIHYAAGASLLCVIATSSGSAAKYVRERRSNVRAGLVLEVATTTGALLGAYFAARSNPSVIAIILGLVLLVSGFTAGKHVEGMIEDPPDRLSTWLRLSATYPAADGLKQYHVYNVPGGFALMFIAGGLSGLLGIGSGALKVLAMDRVMKMPFSVSTTTSNFMIGVTAVASAGIYLDRGYLEPGLALPVTLGVLAGTFLGARVFASAKTDALRWVSAALTLGIAAELLFKGLTGGL